MHLIRNCPKAIKASPRDKLSDFSRVREREQERGTARVLC